MADMNSSDYYSRREQQERALATKAQGQAIKTIHLDMANRYAALVRTDEDMVTRRTLSICGLDRCPAGWPLTVRKAITRSLAAPGADSGR